jgi:beta-galactosidase GanA
MPQIINANGRHAFMVDGAPFLMLGAQAHNSSAWPGTLPKVWAAMDDLHANTLEIPVYWEQFEPQEGKYDTSIVDLMIKGAREHNLRLDFLWFATWKNAAGHYLPLWAKSRPELNTHIMNSRGVADSPSPLSEACMKADMKAFAALMRHIKEVDPIHTVIIIQVENEAGSGGTIRDFSPEATKVFEAPVPADFLKALGGRNGAMKDSGNWQEVFGDNADEYFCAYCTAHYVGQVAAAGKAAYPLPMYVNVALRAPFGNPRPPVYESGGATENVLDIWKTAAPALDLLCPDDYYGDTPSYVAVLDHYSRPDNGLFIPETRGSGPDARRFFAALERGAIGWSPFGFDYTRNTPETIAPTGLNYRMLEPIMREVAKLNFEGKVQAIQEEPEQNGSVSFDFGAWTAVIKWSGGRPAPTGRALVAQISDNQFFVTATDCVVDFKAASGAHRSLLRVEEAEPLEHPLDTSPDAKVYSAASAFRMLRILNGDETDHSLPFSSAPETLRVTLGTY